MEIKTFVLTCIAGSMMLTSTAWALKQDGFLSRQPSPDSLAILPPPPQEDSVTFLADKARYESGRVLRNPDRETLAAQDAHYTHFGRAFSEAFGMEISEKHSPELYQLLARVLQDSHDYAMRRAKEHYQQVRPFVIYKDATCSPEKDKKMATTGSYPSGHASFGWAAALVLSEINPQRETELLRRGIDFGKSRVICGAHWQSDVEAGRLMGAAVVAALHNNAGFMDKLNAARKEFSVLSKLGE